MKPKTQLFLVPTPIGNLEDITLRAIRTLKEVDVVLAEDTRVTGNLLKHFSINKPLLSHHAHNEHQFVEKVVQRMVKGETFALVSDAGTPGISDPGFLLVRQALQQGVLLECLPGPTAFVPALVKSGLPCDRFVFEGFAPQKKGKLTFFAQMAKQERTSVFYESPHRLVKTLEMMLTVMGENRMVSVSREISKLFEETLCDTLPNLIQHFQAHEPKGEIVVVVQGKTEKGKKDLGEQGQN